MALPDEERRPSPTLLEYPATSLLKPLSECRVLLVDDVKTNVDLLVQALRGDYKLSFALSGEAALKVVARTPPDLVLLDVMMPGLDGYEVCRRLRRDPATRETPVLFLSALDEGWNKAAAFEAGGTDYVTKPFDLVEVKARVRSLLRAKSYQDAVREQIASELRIARQIQMSMVPTDFGKRGGAAGLDVFAVLEPAREVGGDLYHFFPAGDGQLCAVVGDVSGKGVPAALFMAITMTLIRTVARQVREPEAILARVNQELAADNTSDMFVTLLCALVDPAAGHMVLASGGHTSPVLLRPGEPPRVLLDSLGTVIGILPDLAFDRYDLALVPGDTVLFHTDGVTEAFDPAGRCYGEDGLLRDLQAGPGASARETIEGVLRSVRAFAQGTPQSDDIAMLAVRYRPADGEA